MLAFHAARIPRQTVDMENVDCLGARWSTRTPMGRSEYWLPHHENAEGGKKSRKNIPAAADGVPTPGGRVVRMGPSEGLGPKRPEGPRGSRADPGRSTASRGLRFARSAGKLGCGASRSSSPKRPLPGPDTHDHIDDLSLTQKSS